MVKVTLDTNEYISALNFRGHALELLHRAIDRDIEIAISRPILDETIRILREKFKWPPYDLHDARLRKIACLVEPKETLAIAAMTRIIGSWSALQKPVRSTLLPRIMPWEDSTGTEKPELSPWLSFSDFSIP